MQVTVIGAGIIGAAVAREVAGRGCPTVLYDSQRPGRGTSGTTFAWINSNEKSPRSYHELNTAGVAAHHELLGRSVGAGQPSFFPTGNLEWAGSSEQEALLTARVVRLVDLGYPVQEIGRDDARSLEPHLRLPPQPRRIFFFPNEGYVLPSLLLAGLLGQAQASGAELNRPVRVEALSSSRGGVTLHLLGGVTRHSDVTVCCAGRWTSALLATAGYDVPLVDPDAAGSPAVGYLAFTRPVGFRCQRVLTTPLLNLRPDGARRLVLQALDLDSTADPAIAPPRDGPVAEALRARLAGVMTGGELAEIDGVRVGQRVLPADGHTVAGFLDEDHHLYVVATHSGITLAPLLGRLVTAEILDEKPQPLLAPFRPGRFGRGEVVRAPASRE